MRVAPRSCQQSKKKKLSGDCRARTPPVRDRRGVSGLFLLDAAGLDNKAIAAELSVGRVQVRRWPERYAESGLASIERDLPRSRRKPVVDAAEIVRLTTQTMPQAATHWSMRTLAREVGVSDTSVLRVWQSHGLKPHRIDGFKVSRYPKSIEELEDVVGL
jgi:transposase